MGTQGKVTDNIKENCITRFNTNFSKFKMGLCSIKLGFFCFLPKRKISKALKIIVKS